MRSKTHSRATDLSPDPTPLNVEGRRRIFSRTWSLTFLTAIAAFNTIDRQIVTILSAPIKAEFQLSDGQVGALGLIYGVVFAIGAAPLATLADRTSRRAVIVSCLTLFSAATAFCGIATHYLMLVISRLGVALGEAGTAAPSQSIIADSYPRQERTWALTIFSVASKPGGFIAFLAGGWIAQYYGWRVTFLLLGIPGLLIAGAAWLVIREPAPGTSDCISPAAATNLKPLSFMCSMRYLRQVPTFWHSLFGAGLWALFSLGFAFWIPHYLQRTHQLGLGVIGTAMAFYTLGVGAAGLLFLGWLAQRLQGRDVRWMLRVVAIAGLVATPFTWLLLTTQSLWVAALSAFPTMFVFSAYLGPATSAAQAVVPARMRTITAGLTQVLLGLMGMGLGPFLPGVVSDLLEPAVGEMSIRYSLLAFSSLWLWASLHFYLASRTLAADMARADLANMSPYNESI